MLQQRPSKYYSFESPHNIIEGNINLKNKLQEETVEYKNLYPWLDPDDPEERTRSLQIIGQI